MIVTGTQAGHIYQLRQAGAVVIWPLTDPAGTTQTQDIVNGRQLQRPAAGDFGVGGPFPEATAFRLGPPGFASTINLNTPGSANFTSGQELASLNRQIGTTTCTWWGRSPVPSTTDNRLELYLNAPDGSTTWTWMPWWWGNTWGGGQLWGNMGGMDLWGNVYTGLSGAWAFFAAILNTIDTSLGPNGASYLYRDGSLVAAGSPDSPRPGNMVWRGFNVVGGSADIANVALFDRVLTLPELETLRLSEEPGPPVEGMTKVWDGTQWVTGTAKGWDGSQWRQAKVWTGEGWQEI